MAAINFPNPSTQTPANTFGPNSAPSSTVNGLTYLWNGVGWRIDNSTSVSNNFLSLDADAGNQIVESINLTLFSGNTLVGGSLATPNISLNANGTSDFSGNMKVGDGAPTNGTGFRVDAGGLLRCARTVTPPTGTPDCISFFNAITNTKLAAFAGSDSLATTAQNPTYTSIIFNDGSSQFAGEHAHRRHTPISAEHLAECERHIRV